MSEIEAKYSIPYNVFVFIKCLSLILGMILIENSSFALPPFSTN